MLTDLAGRMHAHASEALRDRVLGALRSHLAASAGAVDEFDEWLGNVSVQVEVPSRPSGPNV